MITRRALETAGFFTIAAALHVSAAAIMLPEQLERGEPLEAPPAALAAGGLEVQAMVEAWDNVPEVEKPADLPQPPPTAELELAPVAPETLPETQLALAPPPPMSLPDPAPARPNLPEPPPPPRIDPAQLDLPELQELTPPQIAPPLALAASARPERRPERRAAKPEPDPQPRRQQQAAERQPAPAPSPQQAGQGGQSRASSAGGGGGISDRQRASLMSQWGGQIRSCINRRARAPRGLREGGQAVLALTIGRDGAVRGVGLAASSGQPALDQAATDAARRAGRCPAAPAGLNDASYSFELPISLNVR